MDVAAHAPGTVCWIDLGVLEPGAAVAFYGKLFGWTFTDPGADGYRIALLNGRTTAGLGQAEDPPPPYWTLNVSVRDIDAHARAFAAAGARIVVPPAPVGDLGHAAVTLDCGGAPISLWQPGSHTGMQVAGEPGSFVEADLLTRHPAEAADFYHRVLDWDLREKPGGTPGIGLTRTDPPGPTRQASLWLVNFATRDVEATLVNAVRLGAARVPSGSHSGAVLRDPTGALFGLIAAPE